MARSIEDLIKAVKASDCGQIDALLEEGVNINAVYYAETPLTTAIRFSDLALVNYLLEKGANPRCEITRPLQTSFSSGIYDVASRLIFLLSPLTESEAKSLVSTSAHRDSLVLLNLLVANGVNLKDHERTIMYSAGYSDSISVIKYQVEELGLSDLDNVLVSLEEAKWQDSHRVIQYLKKSGYVAKARLKNIALLLSVLTGLGVIFVLVWLLGNVLDEHLSSTVKFYLGTSTAVLGGLFFLYGGIFSYCTLGSSDDYARTHGYNPGAYHARQHDKHMTVVSCVLGVLALGVGVTLLVLGQDTVSSYMALHSSPETALTNFINTINTSSTAK